jgi:hypothetical protein
LLVFEVVGLAATVAVVVVAVMAMVVVVGFVFGALFG